MSEQPCGGGKPKAGCQNIGQLVRLFSSSAPHCNLLPAVCVLLTAEALVCHPLPVHHASFSSSLYFTNSHYAPLIAPPSHRKVRHSFTLPLKQWYDTRSSWASASRLLVAVARSSRRRPPTTNTTASLSASTQPK